MQSKKTVEQILEELNVPDEKPVCYLNKCTTTCLTTEKRKLMQESPIVDNVIKNNVQLHRDLSWLVANSIIEDSLVEVKTRTYYEEALTSNFFIPINECLNENPEILSFNELVTAYNHVIKTATQVLTSMKDVDAWPSNEYKKLPDYSLKSGPRWNDNQRINEITKLSRRLMMPDTSFDQNNEKSLEEFVRNYIKNLTTLEEDILLEYQTEKLLLTFQDDFYLDNISDCKQFPWMSFVEIVSNSLLVHNLYCKSGDLSVYFLDHSKKNIGLPQEIQQKINSLITESNKSLITEQTNKEEEKLEILTEDEEMEDQSSTEALDKSCRNCSLVDINLFEETLNCSTSLSEKISNELEHSFRFEKYLEKVLMEG